jgi:predicted SAM-dependent methyltransferase
MLKDNLKIHLGCGKRYLPGFIHIDIDKHPHIDHYSNIDKLPMLKNNSVGLIYTCHAFEYYDREQAKEVLREWHRVLKTKGVLRIAVPDFEKIVEVYKTYKDIEHQGILGPLFGKWEINKKNKKPECIYHKTTYDFKSLKNILKENGFTNIVKYNADEVLPKNYDDYSKAYIPHMDKNGIHISLNLEATKK